MQTVSQGKKRTSLTGRDLRRRRMQKISSVATQKAPMAKPAFHVTGMYKIMSRNRAVTF